MGLKPRACPLLALARPDVATVALSHQATEPTLDVAVDVDELDGGVPGAKVVAPAAQDRIELRDHIADVRSGAVAAGERPDPLAHLSHRILRGPALKVVAADAALQQAARHTSGENAARGGKTPPAGPRGRPPPLAPGQLPPLPRPNP